MCSLQVMWWYPRRSATSATRATSSIVPLLLPYPMVGRSHRHHWCGQAQSRIVGHDGGVHRSSMYSPASTTIDCAVIVSQRSPTRRRTAVGDAPAVLGTSRSATPIVTLLCLVSGSDLASREPRLPLDHRPQRQGQEQADRPDAHGPAWSSQSMRLLRGLSVNGTLWGYVSVTRPDIYIAPHITAYTL